MESSKYLLNSPERLKNNAEVLCKIVLNDICKQSAKSVFGETVFVCNLCTDKRSVGTFNRLTDMQLHVTEKHIAAFFFSLKPKEMLQVEFQLLCDSLIEREISQVDNSSVTSCNTSQNILSCSLCPFRCLDLNSKRNLAFLKTHMITNANHYCYFVDKISKSLQAQPNKELPQNQNSLIATTTEPIDKSRMKSENQHNLSTSTCENNQSCVISSTSTNEIPENVNVAVTNFGQQGGVSMSSLTSTSEQCKNSLIVSTTEHDRTIESNNNEVNCPVCLKLEKPLVFQDNTLLSLHLFNKHPEEFFMSVKDPYFSAEEFAELCQTVIEVLCHTAEEISKNKVGSAYLSCKFASCSKLMFSSKMVLTEHLVKEHNQSLSNSLKEIQANELKMRFPVPN